MAVALVFEFLGLAVVTFGFLQAPLLAEAGACDDYNCIQGNCVEVSGFPPVKCECKAGWSNILGINALSCAIPQCDFNLGCAKKNDTDNDSDDNSPSFNIFNPCSYSVCGDGDCIRSSNSSGYTCRCHQGYGNLLNSSSGICVADCSFGANCNQLGINLGPTSSPPSSTTGNSSASSDSSGTRHLQFNAKTLVLGALTVTTTLGHVLLHL